MGKGAGGEAQHEYKQGRLTPEMFESFQVVQGGWSMEGQELGRWGGEAKPSKATTVLQQTCNWQENSRKLTLSWRQKQPQPTNLDFQNF